MGDTQSCSVAGLVANGHSVTISRTRGGAEDGEWSRRTADTHSWVWIGSNREFVLVDSGAACQRVMGHPLEFLEQAVCLDRRETLAPIAEDVRDLGPQPLRQHAPLAKPMRKPNCPTPEEIARHELIHLLLRHGASRV